MQRNNVRFYSFVGVVVLLPAFLALGGLRGAFLKGSAAGNPDGMKTGTPTAAGGVTGSGSVTGTPSAGMPVVIPVTGTTNLVLASQILGFDVFLNEGPSTGAVGTPASPSGTIQSPTRSVTLAVTSTGSSGTTSTPPLGSVTGTPSTNRTGTPSSIVGTPSGAVSGSLGSSGLNEVGVGSVVDILVLNNVFLGTDSGSVPLPGATTPSSGLVTPTVSSTRAATATPGSSDTQSATATSAISGIQTPAATRTAQSSTSVGSTPMATQSSTGTSRINGSLNGSRVEGQLVFVIVQLDSSSKIGQAGAKNLVAIPWDEIQVKPSEDKVVVNASQEELRSFPFFSESDWNLLGSNGALESWFTFWDLPIPANMMQNPGTGSSVTPIPSLNTTPTASLDVNPTATP